MTFKKMTPKMTAALVAAEACNNKGGLCYTVAGWIDPGDCWNYHGPVVVSRLVHDHGYLQELGKGRGPNARRAITARGRAWLDHARVQGWIPAEGASATARRATSPAPAGASPQGDSARPKP